jgi:hypothetical protein
MVLYTCAGDASVYTFSMHCGDQTFPTEVQQSDWDIPLTAGTGDDEYLQVRRVGLGVGGGGVGCLIPHRYHKRCQS